jgi:hypothetical protein
MRAIKASLRAQPAARAQTDVVVNLREGTYRLSRPWRLSARDSGVIYQAYAYNVERNVLYGSDEAASGVQPKRIRIASNHWDDDTPFWWPEDTPTDGIALAGNPKLPRSGPAAACCADAACAGIVAGAGRRTLEAGG